MREKKIDRNQKLIQRILQLIKFVKLGKKRVFCELHCLQNATVKVHISREAAGKKRRHLRTSSL